MENNEKYTSEIANAIEDVHGCIASCCIAEGGETTLIDVLVDIAASLKKIAESLDTAKQLKDLEDRIARAESAKGKK